MKVDSGFVSFALALTLGACGSVPPLAERDDSSVESNLRLLQTEFKFAEETNWAQISGEQLQPAREALRFAEAAFRRRQRQTATVWIDTARRALHDLQFYYSALPAEVSAVFDLRTELVRLSGSSPSLADADRLLSGAIREPSRASLARRAYANLLIECHRRRFERDVWRRWRDGLNMGAARILPEPAREVTRALNDLRQRMESRNLDEVRAALESGLRHIERIEALWERAQEVRTLKEEPAVLSEDWRRDRGRGGA